MRWVTFFLLVPLLLVCQALQPFNLECISATAWAESGIHHSGKNTDPTDVIEVSLPGLPEGAYPMRLVRIPSGTFQMGSPDTERGRWEDYEGPVHQVTLGYDFYLGETEVTQAQWKAMMGTNPVIDLGFTQYGVGNDYPVYYVAWEEITQANGFLAKLNALGQGTFRLPSEAEWEYACRAGTTTRFYYGDSLDCEDADQDCAAGTLPGNRSNYMWYNFNYNTPTKGSKPVGGKLPNAFGLYDMHGNIWEWCQDYWHHNYVGAPTDGSAWVLPTYFVCVRRGGDWDSDTWACRSARREAEMPVGHSHEMGVRVVRDASPSMVGKWEMYK